MKNINAITPKPGYPYLKGTLTKHRANKNGERDVYIVGGGPVIYLVKFPSEWERPFRAVKALDLETSPATLKDLIQIKLLNLKIGLKL